jgi:hypothetical protein
MGQLRFEDDDVEYVFNPEICRCYAYDGENQVTCIVSREYLADEFGDGPEPVDAYIGNKFKIRRSLQARYDAEGAPNGEVKLTSADATR